MIIEVGFAMRFCIFIPLSGTKLHKTNEIKTFFGIIFIGC